MTDIIIIGSGPAGVSAALTAKHRNKSVIVISNSAEQSNLWKAKLVENYPGCPGASGQDILKIFRKQLDDAGIEVITARALNALDMGESFSVSCGQDYYDCKALILTVGITQQSTYPGETEFLGRGVSYCATCDGMLYRGKKIAVIGLNEEAEEETALLRSIGCEVEYFDKDRAKNFEIRGGETVTELIADGISYPVEGVFILRSTIAPSSFLSGLELDNGHIVTDRNMKTAVKGVFAAGDCTGRPYQLAVAVGEGNIAAISASAYIESK